LVLRTPFCFFLQAKITLRQVLNWFYELSVGGEPSDRLRQLPGERL